MIRLVLAIIFASFFAFQLPPGSQAQNLPQRPIRIVIGFGAGGGADIIGRIIGEAMQTRLGQSVVIENRPGAAGTIGAETVARADPDGTTLGIMTAGQIISAAMSKSLRYDTLTAFDPISLIGTASLVIVTRRDFPPATVSELIALAKSEPGKIVFGSAGFGATQHLAAELFMQTAGVKMLHVPFRSSPEAITAVLSGQVQVLFDTVSAVLGAVQGGELKALAVTGKDRYPALPAVPAAIEGAELPGFDVTTWYGLFAPRGTPGPTVAKLNATINESLADPAVRARLEASGIVVQGSTPEAFGAFMADELRRWTQVREAAKIPQQ